MAMMCKNRAMKHRVAVFVEDGVIPFELGIPARVFGMARGPDGRRLYEVVTCAARPGPVRTEADFTINVDRGPEALAEADTVVIPSSYEQLAYREGQLPSPVAEAFAHIRHGTRMVSICIGSYVLAAAGLLDGRPATTHWADSEDFQRVFPKVKVNPGVLYVDDGDVLTSAGVAAGIDLCLHIIRRDHGSAVANRVARRCVVPPWRDGGQAQYVERPFPQDPASTTAAAREWAAAHLDRPVTLREMAAQVSMSVRTFTRRFREEVGMSPGQWLAQQRVEWARHLLEETDLPVDEVARRAGFGTSAGLRQHLHATLGVPPLAYRRTFRNGPAAANGGPRA
jgi:transcriptional regulator GlxA family with amidase domain